MTNVLSLFFGLFVLFLGFDASFLYAQPAQRMAPMVMFESRLDGFRISYPLQWERVKFDPIIIAFAAPEENGFDNFQENVNLVIEDLSGDPQDLRDYTQKGRERIGQQIPGAAIVESSWVRPAGRPAYQVVFVIRQGGHSLKFMQVWTIKDQKAYIVSYAAEENNYRRYEGEVRRMLESFQFV